MTTNTAHANCTHPKTKAGRAACRKARAADPFAPGNIVEAKLDDADWATATIVSSHISGWGQTLYFYVRMTRTGSVFEVHNTKVREIAR